MWYNMARGEKWVIVQHSYKFAQVCQLMKIVVEEFQRKKNQVNSNLFVCQVLYTLCFSMEM